VIRVRVRRLALLPMAIALSACGRLDELLYEPLTTPLQWCDRRPCFAVGDLIVNEPLGSFLVFLLAFLWVGVGVSFLRNHRGQRSRTWLGVALVLGGVGAAQAGISYQAFSYALKCAGREHCLLTNGFEVGYSLTQALSVSAMLVAVAYACTSGRLRRGVVVYAGLNVAVYLVVTALGVLVPSSLLLSFEVLMLFAVPGIVLVLVLAARHARHAEDPLGRRLVVAAVLLVVVQVAYFGYYAAGIGTSLWDSRGVSFTANDVLHVGMLIWLGYVVRAVGPVLRDATE